MNVAIIVAAGHGRRMSRSDPKQFLELAGVPIIFHTLKAFEDCDVIEEIIVVLPEQRTARFHSWAYSYGLRKIKVVVEGGTTRAESVLNGLHSVTASSAEIVAVHDGVRPFVTPDEIARTVEAANLEGAAILVSSPVDTMKEVKDGAVVRTLARANLRNALTPQCFRYELLRRAFDNIEGSLRSFTDESSLVERLGAKIATVEGSARNIKITTRDDLAFAETIMKSVGSKLEPQKIGFGSCRR